MPQAFLTSVLSYHDTALHQRIHLASGIFLGYSCSMYSFLMQDAALTYLVTAEGYTHVYTGQEALHMIIISAR